MPKAYSQDLRDRVIDAVERGARWRRGGAALRNQRIRGDWRFPSGLTGWLARTARRHRASKLMAHRDFLQATRTEKTDVTHQALCDRLSAERGQSRHLDDEPLLSQDWRDV